MGSDQSGDVSFVPRRRWAALFERYGPALFSFLIATGVMCAQPPTASPAQDVAQFIRQLASQDSIERSSAAFLLGRLGADAKIAGPALVAALRDPDEAVRRTTAEALGLVKPDDPDVVPALISALSDNSESVRVKAALSLGVLTSGSDRAVRVLITTLGDPSRAVRQSAISAFHEIGVAAAPQLISAIKETNVELRDAAIASLREVGPAVVPTLIEVLKDRSELLRSTAAEILGRFYPPSPATVPALSSALTDESETVRQSVSNALRNLGPAAVPTLVKALHDKNETVRITSVSALRLMHSQSEIIIPGLLSALSDPSEAVRKGAVEALIFAEPDYRKQVLGGLRNALNDRSPAIRQAAVAALSLPSYAPDSLLDLARAVKDNDEHVREKAMESLSWQDRSQLASLVPVFSLALSDSSQRVRVAAARALANLGPLAEPAVPQLIRARKDSDGSVRMAVVSALARVARDDHSVIPELIAALDEPDKLARLQVVFSLRDIGLVTLPALVSAMNSHQELIRSGAIQALSHMDAQPTAVPAIIAALTDEAAVVRVAAAEALAFWQPKAPGVVQALSRALHDSNVEVRQQAVRALSWYPGKETLSALLSAMSDQDALVRSFAVNGIGRSRPDSDDVMSALLGALNDTDPMVRLGAATSLGQIKAPARQAIPLLISALKGDDEKLRRAAALALGNIGSAAVPALAVTLQDHAPTARRGAAEALMNLGIRAQTAVPELAGALKDMDAGVRQAVIRALGVIGPAAAVAVPALIDLLRQESFMYRDSPARYRYDDERIVIVQALGGMATDATAAMPNIVSALGDQNEELSKASSAALIKAGTIAIPELVRAFTEKPSFPDRNEVQLKRVAFTTLSSIAENLEDEQDPTGLDQMKVALAAASSESSPHQEDLRRLRRAVQALDVIQREQLASGILSESINDPPSLKELDGLDLQSAMIEVGGKVVTAATILTRGDDKQVRLRGNTSPELGGIQGFVTATVKGTQQRITFIIERGKQRIFRPYNKSYAILVAISDYPAASGYRRLPQAVAQARQLEGLLRGLGFEILRTLYNSDATAENIRKSLREAPVGENDRLFVYFGGHGDDLIPSKSSAKNAIGFIVPYDASQDNLRQKGIMLSELKGPLAQAIAAKQVLFALDSCQSGLIADRGKDDDDERRLRALRGIEAMSREYGRMFLTAGTGGQPALDINGGIFTKALIEALKGNADSSKDGIITFPELYAFMSDAVNQEAQSNGRQQDVGWEVAFGRRGWVFVTDRSLIP